MARPESDILANDVGRAQSAALGVVCVLAGLQLGLLGWSAWEAVKKSGSGGMETESSPREERLATGAMPAEDGAKRQEWSLPPRPGELAGVKGAVSPVSSGLTPPEPGMLAGEGGQSAGERVPPAMPSSLAVPTLPKPDPEVAELLQTVAQLRAGGETEGLMELLKAAEGMDQNHPAVLQEFALTYEQMGLTEKARDYWQRIVGLGQAVSGAFFDLAQKRLERMGAGQAAGAMDASQVAILKAPNVVGGVPLDEGEISAEKVTSESGAALGVGSCRVVRDLAVSEGDKRRLRIPIVRLGASPVESSAVNVDVFFYDRVNGGKVEPTRADPPVVSWVASPVDWKGEGIEALDVTYFLPAMSAQEVLDHGKRDFYGYLVKLYYQDRLQAVVAEPRDLLEESPGSNSASPSTLGTGR